MGDFSPLTKEERERLVTDNEKALAECAKSEWEIDWATRDLIRYEATVAALEAEIERLRPLAETGEAVEAMPIGRSVNNAAWDDIWPGEDWLVWEWDSQKGGHHLLGQGPTALAALRAARGENGD